MTVAPPTAVKGYWNARSLSGTGSSYTLNMSNASTGTPVATGDWIFFVVGAAGPLTTARTPSLPSGFEEVVSWRAMGTSTSTSWAVWAKKRVAGETNYTAALDSSGAHTVSVTFQAYWFDGTDIPEFVNWIIGTIQSRVTSGGTFSDIAPTVNTLVDNSTAHAIFAERTTAADTDVGHTISGTGWTKTMGTFIESVAGDVTFDLAHKAMPTAGATGAVTRTTLTTQATNGAALQIIWPPKPDLGPVGVAGHLWNGTVVENGNWFVAGASDTILGTDWAGMIWPGYSTIPEMLAAPFFYCSHRGGSANWPESSLQGYTQSALRGYGALEISLARSSDGVWFGLHDASLDRTSLGTGGGSGTTYVASSMTWAEIQTHDLLPASSAPVDALHKPYMTLDELLDAYLKSHVIFIDPKSALANRAELISILQNRPDWQDKIVAKYVPGNSNNTWLSAARTAGFVTNAMFYETDTFASFHSQGDILGMEYGATSGTWTSIKSFGKPVMAHVCPNTAAVSSGIAQGADGAIVSGPVQTPIITMP